MRLDLIFALATTTTLVSALPQCLAPAHLHDKRQFPTTSPDGSGYVGTYVADPARAAAFSTQTTNYDSLISKSKAAAASGGLSTLFSSFIPSSGNPFASYYAGNPTGKASTAKTNNYGSSVAPVVGLLRGALSGDETKNILSIMAQVDNPARVP